MLCLIIEENIPLSWICNNPKLEFAFSMCLSESSQKLITEQTKQNKEEKSEKER